MLVAGSLESDEGTIDAPIGRSTRQRTRMAVTARGRQARTEYRVVGRFLAPVPCTLLEARLDTGRTHQVRVHLAAIGHPVIGDERYGGSPARPRSLTAPMAPGRLFLHAFRLSLDHPSGGRRTWEAPLPDDLVGRPGGPVAVRADQAAWCAASISASVASCCSARASAWRARRTPIPRRDAVAWREVGVPSSSP